MNNVRFVRSPVLSKSSWPFFVYFLHFFEEKVREDKKNRHRMANARTYLELYNYFPLIGFSLGMEKRADDPSAGQDNRRVWQDVDGGGRPGSDFSCVRN